jgi:ureidoglycolate lyase
VNPEHRTLPIEPLTRAAFVRYGEVIETGGVAAETINAGTAQKFANLARVLVSGEDPAAAKVLAPSAGNASIGIYRAQPRLLPMQLLELERHPLGSQAFVPLRPARYLVVVAGDTPEGAPEAEAVHVFLASGQQGVNLRAGVWHHALLVLERESDFLVVERASQEGNLQRFDTSSWGLWLDV